MGLWKTWEKPKPHCWNCGRFVRGDPWVPGLSERYFCTCGVTRTLPCPEGWNRPKFTNPGFTDLSYGNYVDHATEYAPCP